MRPASETAQLWIPDAIRVSTDFLNSNDLIRNTDAVFVLGDAADERHIYEAVQGVTRGNLKPLRIVSGGVREWHFAGGRVAGNISVLDAPAVVDTKAFHELVRQGATVAMVGKPSREQKQYIRNLVELPAAVNIDKNIATLRLKQGAALPIVLVLPDDMPANDWSRAWAEAAHRTLYIFVDSGSRYASFLDEQRQIAANAGKPLQPRCDLH